MSEHGWPGHDDHDDGLPDPADDLLTPYDDPPAGADLPGDDVWDVPGPEPAGHHDLPGAPEQPHTPGPDPGDPPDPVRAEPVAAEPVGADPDATAEPAGGADVFPPVLDVGPLPEPVDGFPWIDTADLGPAGPAALHPAGAPTAQDLAGYAAADLPPGADPWAALEASDDPATAALARFYRPAGPGS
jgi:hypothetical protein